MHSYILLFVFLKTTPVSLTPPTGIKLCEERCVQAQGCFGFCYDDVHLRCDMQRKDDKRSGFLYVPVGKKEKRCGLKVCQDEDDWCIKARRGSHVCIASSKIPPRNRNRRLFILLPRSGRAYQLNVHNMSLKTYRFHNVRNIRNMLYMEKTNGFIITTCKPHTIGIYDKFGKKLRTILNGVLTTSVTFDEERQLFFCTARGDNSWIMYSISTKQGENTPPEKSNFGMATTEVVADKVREVLYVIAELSDAGDNRVILSMSYKGKDRQTILNRKGLRKLCFDNTDNALYFVVQQSVYKMYLNENRLTEVLTCKRFPVQINISKRKLFICFRNVTGFHFLDVQNHHSIQIKKKGVERRIQMCFIY